MNNFNQISIVGDGLSAWMVAAFMARQLRHTGAQVTIHTGVEPEDVADIQSPLPHLHPFLSSIGVSLEKFVRETTADIKLGNAYFFEKENPFFHVWGEYGAPKGVIEAHQLLIRFFQLKGSIDINKLSIGSAFAVTGRFKMPVKEKGSIYATYENSLSFKTKPFLGLLRSVCETLGVQIRNNRVQKIENRDGAVLVMNFDGEHKADYCINTVLEFVSEKSSLVSLHESLPFKLTHIRKGAANPWTMINKVQAVQEGWMQEVSHKGDVELRQYHLSHVDSGEAYINSHPREKNILNFGSAMASLQSPLIASIDLNLIALKLLMRYFPSATEDQSVSREFNKTIVNAVENLRDITQLCLKLLFDKNEAAQSVIELSPMAEYKIDLFKRRGRYPVLDNEYYKPQWQVWLLIGLGFRPQNLEPVTLALDAEKVRAHIAQIEKSVLNELSSVPLVGKV
jgi:Tryptophan halogenase